MGAGCVMSKAHITVALSVCDRLPIQGSLRCSLQRLNSARHPSRVTGFDSGCVQYSRLAWTEERGGGARSRMRPGLYASSLGSQNETASKAQVVAPIGRHLHIKNNAIADEVRLQTSKD